MCFQKDDSAKRMADEQRQQEQERQARVAAGTQKVNETFAGFDDPYYEKYSQSYKDYYAPQLKDQYAKAQKDLTLQLAPVGGLQSSAGAKRMAELTAAYEKQNQDVLTNSIAAANARRAEIEQTRGNLASQIESGAGIDNIANQASSRAAAYSTPATFSPLADVFKSLTANAVNNQMINADQNKSAIKPITFNPGANSGSVRVINN